MTRDEVLIIIWGTLVMVNSHIVGPTDPIPLLTISTATTTSSSSSSPATTTQPTSPSTPPPRLTSGAEIDTKTTNTNRIKTPPRRPKKPHVILIVADDIGWNDVSWNNPNVVTPHLGELARGGIILNQSYVLPTCTPTRAALLTGRYPFTMGMQKGALKPLDPTGLPLSVKILPQFLKKRGYSTHAIGKWHLGYCSWRYTPTRRGFDTFYGFYTGYEDYYSHDRRGKKSRKKSGKHSKNDNVYLDLRNNTSPDHSKKGIYSTYLFASVAEDLLRSRNSKKPMFLYLPFQSVHAPLQVPRNYSRVFKHVKNIVRRNYLGMVMAMDDAVGRVVAALKATRHYDNSIIIFTTDNGGSIGIGASNWPLRGGKANLLEGGTRGPAFIHSPLLPNPGSVSNQLFHVTDWFSTIVSLAGGETPRVLDGVNQWPSLAGYSDPPRKGFVYNIDNPDGKFKAAIRMQDMKLAVGEIGKKEWAPFHPIRYRTEKLHSSFPSNNSSSSFGDAALQFSLQESGSAFSEIEFNGRYLNSSEEEEEEEEEDEEEEEEEEGRSVFSNSARSLNAFIAVYGRNSHKKKNKVSKKKRKNKKKKKKEAKIKQKKKKEKLKLKRPDNFKPKFEEKGLISWRQLKEHEELEWNPKLFRKLDSYLLDKTKLRLYNITADPGETNNVVQFQLFKAQTMLNQLANELDRYVKEKDKKKVARGLPTHFNNVWSPGWCIAS